MIEDSAPGLSTARVVSARGDGTYRTIADALIGATPGTRIIVHPGTYTAPLSLDVPVEIVGEGAIEKIVLQMAGGPCVTSRAPDVALRNLTIRNEGIDLDEVYAAVQVSAGTLRLEGCRVASAMSAGVSVEGNGAQAIISRCRFAYVLGSAIVATRRGRATITDSLIERAHTGVTVRQGGILEMARCTLRSCANAGLSFYEYGSGTVDDCDLEGMGAMGIGILQGSDPTIRRCTLRDGEMNGIGVLMHGIPLIEDCDISGHGMEGVVIRTVGKPTLRRCTITNGTHVGIGVYERGQGTFEDCEITDNMFGGILVEAADSTPTLRRCRVQGNDNFGLSFGQVARGLLDECNILGTVGTGIYIGAGAEPVIRNSTIADGRSDGIVVTQWARGRIEGCRITCNAETGITISDEAHPTLVGCQIHANGDAGIWVDEYGRGAIASCDITHNAGPGVRITRGGNPILRACRVHDGQDGGIIIAEDGHGRIEECDESDNAPATTPQDADSASQRADERRRMTATGDIVFCVCIQRHPHDELYAGFVTENDVRLLALAYAVEEGRMAADEACASWAEIYGEPLDDALTRGGRAFPRVATLVESDGLPARAEFCTHLRAFDIRGVNVAAQTDRHTLGHALCVTGATTLAKLREALRGEYKIVDWPDDSYLAPYSLVHANRLIRHAQRA